MTVRIIGIGFRRTRINLTNVTNLTGLHRCNLLHARLLELSVASALDGPGRIALEPGVVGALHGGRHPAYTRV